MAGKTFRVSYLANAGTPSMRIELQMGPWGRPQYVRSLNSWSTSFTEYTGRRARSCDGALLTDELVLAYTVVADKSMFLPDVFKGWIDDGKGGRMRTDARAFRWIMAMYSFSILRLEMRPPDGLAPPDCIP